MVRFAFTDFLRDFDMKWRTVCRFWLWDDIEPENAPTLDDERPRSESSDGNPPSTQAGNAEQERARSDCLQRDADVYLLLAGCRHCVERYGLVGILCRRHLRALYRQDRAVVCAGDHAAGGNGRGALHRELRHVRSRRRVSRGEGGDGRDAGEVFRVGADVRLHPHGADQRRLGRTVSDRTAERAAAAGTYADAAHECRSSGFCDCGDDLLLVGERQRHPRIEREGPAHYVCDHRDGGDDGDVVLLHTMDEGRPPAAMASSAQHYVPDGSAWRRTGVPEPFVAAAYSGFHWDTDRPRALRAGDERRRDDGPGVSRDRASQAAKSEEGSAGDFSLQPDLHRRRGFLCSDDHSGRRTQRLPGQPDRRTGDVPYGAAVSAPRLPRVRGDGGCADAGGRGEYRDCRLERRAEPCLRRWNSAGMVSQAAPPVWDLLPHSEPGRRPADPHHHP